MAFSIRNIGIRNRSLAIVVCLPILCSLQPSLAQATSRELRAATRKAKDKGQDAVIKVDGAAVYEAANFDAPVIEYLDSGKKAKISRKIYPGIGGLGTFYKIRLRQNVYGYIADTDVTVKKRGSGDDDESAPKKSEAAPEKVADSSEMKDEPDDIKNSFYLDHYFGIGYYSVNYGEKISTEIQNATTPLYSFKFTGPTGFLGGVPMDMSLFMTATAPSFYNSFSTGVSGFLVYFDFMPFFTITESKRFYTYWGLGALIKYEDWTVRLRSPPAESGPPVPSQEVDLGVDVGLGAAVKLSSKLALRLEGKYFWEVQRYFGFGGALEFKY